MSKFWVQRYEKLLDFANKGEILFGCADHLRVPMKKIILTRERFNLLKMNAMLEIKKITFF
jgi:hypothetical protein